jgi:hypothetical protein
MGTKKLSFKDISNVLSRAELKNIMAGSSGSGSGGSGGSGCRMPNLYQLPDLKYMLE